LPSSRPTAAVALLPHARVQLLSQPSPLLVLPSSQVSAPALMPLPQNDSQQLLSQPSPSIVLPSSQASSKLTIPSPHPGSTSLLLSPQPIKTEQSSTRRRIGARTLNT
jgi:hypothetical protein